MRTKEKPSNRQTGTSNPLMPWKWHLDQSCQKDKCETRICVCVCRSVCNLEFRTAAEICLWYTLVLFSSEANVQGLRFSQNYISTFIRIWQSATIKSDYWSCLHLKTIIHCFGCKTIIYRLTFMWEPYWSIPVNHALSHSIHKYLQHTLKKLRPPSSNGPAFIPFGLLWLISFLTPQSITRPCLFVCNCRARGTTPGVCVFYLVYISM